MPKNGIVQWGWVEMEELLQCPVCLDIPASGPGITVEQCIHGHHICSNCKTQVESCPLCKCAFHGTRNFVVEELVRHYEVLKNTMLLNSIVTESKPKKKPKLALNAKTPAFKPVNITPRRSVNTPNASKGNYPCRVPDCKVHLPLGRLLNHVRSFHGDLLTEAIVDFTDSYTHTLEIPFRNRKPVNRYSYIIFVSGIGLVFFNIEILRPGQLVAVVQMAMQYKDAQNFLACIEFYSETNRYSYNTRLISIRDETRHMMERRCCFTLSKNQLRNICVNKKFNCKMRLSRFNPVDTNLLTRPNIEQINIVSGIRASLIVEEKDKKLVKELEVCNSKKSNTNGPVSEQVFHIGYIEVVNLPTSTNGNSSREAQNGLAVSVEPAGARRSKKRNRKNRAVLQGSGSTNAN